MRDPASGRMGCDIALQQFILHRDMPFVKSGAATLSVLPAPVVGVYLGVRVILAAQILA